MACAMGHYFCSVSNFLSVDLNMMWIKVYRVDKYR